MRRNILVCGAMAALLALCAFATAGLAGEQKATDAAAIDKAETAKPKGPLAEAWESFRIKWELGGPTMWALGALALVAVVFSVDRLVGLRRARIVPKGLADEANRLWQQGDFARVISVARRRRSTLGRVIAFLVERRTNSYEHLTAAVEDIAALDFERHTRGNYPLVAVGTLAPLLGLLGTVFGLLGAFATIGVVGSMDDPSALAGDIGEALITTAAGLIIAIPTLILYHYFNSRTSQFAGILGEEVGSLMHDWFLEKETLDASQG